MYMLLYLMKMFFIPIVSFFFFQAEDGIRVLYVTGVQTCALPIWDMIVPAAFGIGPVHRRAVRRWTGVSVAYPASSLTRPGRSEERRVGKERRFQGRSCSMKRARNIESIQQGITYTQPDKSPISSS